MKIMKLDKHHIKRYQLIKCWCSLWAFHLWPFLCWHMFLPCGGGLVAKSCPTLVTPWTIACLAPLSMGFSRVRILEWVAISFSRGSSQLQNQTSNSCIVGRFFTNWATREAHVPSLPNLLRVFMVNVEFCQVLFLYDFLWLDRWFTSF